MVSESGISLFELGRRMGYSEATARQAAWQFLRSGDPRMGTLRKFAVAMNVQLDELTLRRRRMSKRLVTELEEAKCEMDPGMFRELVEERHRVMYPSWTFDDLVCHPDEAKVFCGQICAEVGAVVPDHVVLRTLLNARKAH
jgi:hypothetical protein